MLAALFMAVLVLRSRPPVSDAVVELMQPTLPDEALAAGLAGRHGVHPGARSRPTI